MKYSKAFKHELSLLPSKEKDKLLLRLLKRDEILSEKLYFELVSTDSVDDVRTELEDEMLQSIENFSKYNNSPKEIIRELRYHSGRITRHLKITKDKYGEISLTILMLNLIIEKEKEIFEHSYYEYKLLMYVLSRSFKVLLLIDKIHEDYKIDFKDDIQKLGENISSCKNLREMSTKNNLNIQWFLQYEIPEDIQDIYKETRANGLLR